MGATTTRKTRNNGNSAPAEPSHSEQRDQLIAQYKELSGTARAARESGDKKSAASQEARMSNLSQKIRHLETELEIEGVEFVPFQKERRSVGSSAPSMTQEQIEARMALLGPTFHNTDKPSVKRNVEQQIEALLKKAKKAGYEIADPRK